MSEFSYSPADLDAMTGGALSAPTSSERAARVREWLGKEPAPELMQEVFKELSAKDKGAAKALREKLDELKREKNQQTMATEWAQKAEKLLSLQKMNVADALAWQRDAAKAGAALSKAPLQTLKDQLAERVKHIEDLQHLAQVQREAAMMLAQRIEMFSTKPWSEGDKALPDLQTDVQAWRTQTEALPAQEQWGSVDAKFPVQLESAGAQLVAVWEAFAAALAQTKAAAQDASLPLPQVPVWAEEIRALRGQASQASQGAEVAQQDKSKANKPDQKARKTASAAVRAVLASLEKELEEGHGKASVAAANAVRAALKEQGHLIDAKTDFAVQSALAAAAELEGWQRWRANQIREDLIGKAQALVATPAAGRKQQEAIRDLREQWKQTDQGGMANNAMWKHFDEACTAAHKVVEEWLHNVRAQEGQSKATREALIAEVQQWAQDHAARTDWRAITRELHHFAERWRNAGHLGEKLFEQLQAQWKTAIKLAHSGLEAAQKRSTELRRAMIEESTQLAAQTPLRIDAVKALQGRWQAEAQTVPLERKTEQKMWEAFRQPIDAAFARKSEVREKAQAAHSAHDQAVLAAVTELDAANASGDAQKIHAAMAALQAAIRHQAVAAAPVAPVAEIRADAAVEKDAQEPESAQEPSPTTEDAPAAAPTPAPAVKKPVVAMRGDDRPGAKKSEAASTTPQGKWGGRDAPRHGAARGDKRKDGRHDGRTGERMAERGARGAYTPRDEQTPRLSNQAFYAQRDAIDRAQTALKKLSAQAHGESLLQVLDSWQARNAEQLPAVAQLGKALSPQMRGKWAGSLSQAAGQGDAAQALLRLEMAADLPTPAEHLPARRALQLQMLTQRKQAAPAQTWGDDVAAVLATGHEAGNAKRLQAALAKLLR